ncbi:hypothetical protein FRC03_000534 [Tulasnella sp. 419]|nr:hypothetical protein FRC03_000534 [Tulasnella sp. 419]
MDSQISHQHPSSSVFPLHNLPSELFISIIHHSRTQDEFAFSDLSDLRSFSLVSSKWRSIAQKMIFAKVMLHNVSQAKTFLSSIQSNRSLGEATRFLQLRRLGCLGQPDTFLWALIRSITESCPRLYGIGIAFDDKTPREDLLNLFDHTFENLRSLTFSIDFRVHSSSPKLSFHDILDFIGLFSSLGHLNFVEIGGAAST